MSLKCVCIILIFNIIQLVGCQIYAQETKNDTIKKPGEIIKPQNSISEITWKPTMSLYLELLGKYFYSFNVDFRIKQTRAISFGIGYSEDAFTPSLMYYHFGGERYRFELGGGVSGVITGNNDLAGMGIHGNIGYRYQKKQGWIFRTGFTPFFAIPFTDAGRFMFVPWAGISIGYSF